MKIISAQPAGNIHHLADKEQSRLRLDLHGLCVQRIGIHAPQRHLGGAVTLSIPLGTPIDFRLSVSPAGGNAASDSETVDRNSVLSVTDIVLQNPDGSVGKVTILRNDDILLQSELANFRDLDLHFVAPFVFEEGDDINLLVDCRTPAPGGTECPVGASFLGFIDEAN